MLRELLQGSNTVLLVIALRRVVFFFYSLLFIFHYRIFIFSSHCCTFDTESWEKRKKKSIQRSPQSRKENKKNHPIQLLPPPCKKNTRKWTETDTTLHCKMMWWRNPEGGAREAGAFLPRGQGERGVRPSEKEPGDQPMVQKLSPGARLKGRWIVAIRYKILK